MVGDGAQRVVLNSNAHAMLRYCAQMGGNNDCSTAVVAYPASPSSTCFNSRTYSMSINAACVFLLSEPRAAILSSLCDILLSVSGWS